MKFIIQKRNLALFCIATLILISFSSNPPNGRTGAPGDGLCSGCHGGGGGGFDGNITLSGLPGNANPNETYSLTLDVDVTAGSPMRAGFQMVALLDGDDSNAGDLLNPSGSSTLTASNSKEYWEHNPAVFFGGGTNVSWDVEWTAPNVTDGVTFYLVSILGNGSGSGGDQFLITTEQTSVTASMPIDISFINQINNSCFGESVGSVEAVPSGGMEPYEFEWSNNTSESTIEDVEGGFYSVTVTDVTGNSSISTVEILEPDQIEASNIDITEVSCNGFEDAAVEIFATGGTGDIECTWPDGFVGCDRSDLSPGEYEINLSDENECTGSTSFEISEPEVLAVVMSATNVSGAGNDGTATAVPNGGTAPYDYEWSNDTVDSGTSSTITDLTPGLYEVLVIDVNGCEVEGEVTVLGSGCSLSADADVQNVSCGGASDGAINLNLMNASGMQSYTWSTGDNTASLENLSGGVYSVTVDDGICSDTINNIMLVEPDTLTATLLVLVKPSCAETNNGRITIGVEGGTEGYDIVWNTGLTNDTTIINMDTLINIPDTLINLGVGEYIYELTDANGCMATDTVVLENGDALLPFIMVPDEVEVELDELGQAPALEFSDIDMGSFDNCGIATIDFSTPDFDCSNIGRQDYPVQITDTNGNVATQNVSIIVVEYIAPVIDCSNSPVVSNSCGAISYNLPLATDNCDAPIVELTAGLASGSSFPGGVTTVTFRATDACGNSAECSFTVTVNNDLTADVIVTNESCNDNAGSIEVVPTGGTAPYMLQPFGSLTQGGLSAGNYNLTLVDANGCSIDLIAMIQNDDTNIDATITTTDVSCNGGSDGTVEVALADPQNFMINYNGFDPDSLSAGMYQVVVSNMDGCSETIDYTITEPTEISFAVLDNGIDLCDGQFDVDLVSLDIIGGTPPYSVSSTFESDVLEINVIDANGCETSSSTVINVAEPLTIDGDIMNATDVDNSGSINVTISGGTPGYMFVWTDESGGIVSNEEDLIGVNSGNYTLTVEDALGCFLEATYFVDINSSTIDLDEDDELIKLYPNPSRQFLTLEFNNAIPNNISFYNLSGQRIMTVDNSFKNKTQVDINELSKGLHMVKMEFADKTIVKRFLKM